MSGTASSATGGVPVLRIVEAEAPPDIELPAVSAIAPPIIAVALSPERLVSSHWLDTASFTLTEVDTDDIRCVWVESIDDAVVAISERCKRFPITASVNADVFASALTSGSLRSALITESLAYSTLQAGPEFARWLLERGPSNATVTSSGSPVEFDRVGDTLRIVFNRPHRHNAFNDAMRSELLAALTVAHHDPSISAVELSGAGRSFCSGGDLAEFGGFDDPASAHIARTRHSPALALDAVRARLGTRCRATVHGQVIGSGLEMAAFCGHVVAHRDTRFGLPELGIGLIPGAGGTYSIPRRIGRWRSAYLVLSGITLDAPTLRWGLVDEVSTI